MQVRVLAIGRLKAGAERDLAARYLDRARAAGRSIGLAGFEVTEFAESRLSQDAARRREEADRLLSACQADERRVVLDEQGAAMSSAAFASQLGEWRDAGARGCVFLIGGPDGHHKTARSAANLVLGLGAMTWPHQLVRILLAEQLYRAVSILSGHPYHRA